MYTMLLALPQLLGAAYRLGIGSVSCNQERVGQEGHLPVTACPKLIKLSDTKVYTSKYFATMNWLITSSFPKALSYLKFCFPFVVCGIHYSTIYFELLILVLFGYISLGCVCSNFSFS